ncbi:MAG: phosphopantetheine-binding protein [Luteolibacter sp.]
MNVELTESLRELIDSHLFPLGEEIDATTDLHAEGLDSLALMQLILLIEKEHAVSIVPADLDRENFSTLGNIAALIVRKQEEA